MPAQGRKCGYTNAQGRKCLNACTSIGSVYLSRDTVVLDTPRHVYRVRADPFGVRESCRQYSMPAVLDWLSQLADHALLRRVYRRRRSLYCKNHTCTAPGCAEVCSDTLSPCCASQCAHQRRWLARACALECRGGLAAFRGWFQANDCS